MRPASIPSPPTGVLRVPCTFPVATMDSTDPSGPEPRDDFVGAERERPLWTQIVQLRMAAGDKAPRLERMRQAPAAIYPRLAPASSAAHGHPHPPPLFASRAGMTCCCPPREQAFRPCASVFSEDWRMSKGKDSIRRPDAIAAFHCSNRSSRPRRGLLPPANGTLPVCPSAPRRNPGQTSRRTSRPEWHWRSPAARLRPAG